MEEFYRYVAEKLTLIIARVSYHTIAWQKGKREHNEPSISYPMAKPIHHSIFMYVISNASMFRSFSHSLTHCLTVFNSLYVYWAKLFCETFFCSRFSACLPFCTKQNKTESHKLYIGCRRYLPRYHTLFFEFASKKKRNSDTRTREKICM